MDPLIAFSLVCGVIQIVDFSTKLLAKGREIYRNGVSTESREFEDMAIHLKDLQTNLTVANESSGGSKSLFDDDADLQALATKCCETARELIAELDTLKTSGRHKTLQTIKKTFRAVRRKPVIDGIQTKLDRYQEVLETRTVVSLRHRHNLALLEQRDGFKNLDSKVQSLVTSLAAGRTSFIELSDLIQQESESVKEQIAEGFHQHRMNLAEAEYCKKFLESLHFPEIQSRLETITEAYEKTFQWIFDISDEAVRPWNNFAQWLESGQDTYWISGKAGSGKSTLMSYIYNNPQTIASLKRWSGTRGLLTPSFFFWKAGSALQKSSVGLLRSLLYQILEQSPHLVLSLVQIDKFSQTKVGLLSLPPLPAWTERRLLETLRTLVRGTLSSCRLCIFVDGLDEFEGNQDDLVALIQNLVENPDVKVCLSSRPYRSFTDAFSTPAMLRLQDLTKEDITLYVTNKPQLVPRQRWLMIEKPEWISRLNNMLIQKAEGVFLWVELAVRYQIEGLKNDDSLEQLEKKISLLPVEIERLYSHMLGAIEKSYWEETATYFRMVLELSSSPSIADITFMLYERRDEIFSATSTLSLDDILSRCCLTRRRISKVCAGFLEISHPHGCRANEPTDSDPSSKSNGSEVGQRGRCSSAYGKDNISIAKDLTHIFYCNRVGFIHRTAHDFFRENAIGKAFLMANTNSVPPITVLYAQALLAKVMVFPPKEKSRRLIPTERLMTFLPQGYCHASSLKDEIQEIKSAAIRAERETKQAQSALNEKLYHVLKLVDQQYESQYPGSPWFTRWDPVFADQGFQALPSSMTFAVENFSFQSEINGTEGLAKDIGHKVSILPCEFLSYAAYYGLHRYVLQVLNTQHESSDQYLMTHLLRRATDSVPYWDMARLDLASELLTRGADPNVEVIIQGHTATPWTNFLQAMVYVSRRDREDDIIRYGIEYLGLSIVEWTTAIELFLTHGANINAMVYGRYIGPFNPFNNALADAVSSEAIGDADLDLDVTSLVLVSVLVCLQQLRDSIFDLDEVLGTLIARRARLAVRFEKFLVNIATGVNVCCAFDLSEHEKLSNDLAQHLISYSNGPSSCNFPTKEGDRALAVRVIDELDVRKILQRKVATSRREEKRGREGARQSH